MQTINDTIVAVATPPGVGALGIIRLSGYDSINIIQKIFRGKNLIKQPSHTLHFGKIVDGEEIIDEVVVSLFKSPKSYTGENIVEISCHGSSYILEQVLNLCLKHGARTANAGEFTLKAFLNGKLDLAQAEAVADLISGQTEAAHKTALHNLRGGFSTDLKAMREQLVQFSALLELELDFSQEDVEFADRKKFFELIEQLTLATKKLIDSFSLGNVIKNGVNVAIIGKPNAGKSTLLNALVNEDRAIVSDIAGTTRDTIEETLNISGILFRLVDTAGLREHSLDILELQGMERSREAMNKADIIIYLFDSDNFDLTETEAWMNNFVANKMKFLLVANKTDLTPKGNYNNELQSWANDVIEISALNGYNIDKLKDALYHLVAGGQVKREGTIITNARHYLALQDVLQSLQDIKRGLDTGLASDLISLDIRSCLYNMGLITGQVTTEDKLDYIFSKFCIGK